MRAIQTFLQYVQKWGLKAIFSGRLDMTKIWTSVPLLNLNNNNNNMVCPICALSSLSSPALDASVMVFVMVQFYTVPHVWLDHDITPGITMITNCKEV